MNLTILGAGLIGAPMIIDLVGDNKYKIKAVDISSDSLAKLNNYPVETLVSDLSMESNVKEAIADSDIVINAVPGSFGFQTLRWIIESGKNVVDIAFYENDPFELDSIAREKNITAIVDCGVSPGLSNLLIGKVQEELDRINRIRIFVGGLPTEKVPPLDYKAVFSPTDVIEEYIRPARMIIDGSEVEKPALSEVELINFPETGWLEAFNSDGLRTLLKTVKAQNMVEKTLRYPGHVEKINLLKQIGFLSKEPVKLSEKDRVRPVELTAQLLKPVWKLNEDERDFTVLRVEASGWRDENKVEYQFDMYDEFDAESKTISMARTTGYTATSAVRMLANGLYEKKGISPPEFIGRNAQCCEFILNELKKRGITTRTTKKNEDSAVLN
jgi:saccharopine dehydrogenase-like NADP-dependent oxidoreductase